MCIDLMLLDGGSSADTAARNRVLPERPDVLVANAAQLVVVVRETAPTLVDEMVSAFTILSVAGHFSMTRDIAATSVNNLACIERARRDVRIVIGV